MGWTEVATDLGTQAFLAGLKAAQGRVSKRQYKRIIATTIAQVLALHPDVGRRKARRRAEKMAGIAPSKKLIKAKKQLGVREGAEAAATALITGGALKAVKAVGGKLARNGSRKRASSPRTSGRAAAREQSAAQPTAEAPSSTAGAGAENTE